MNDLFPDQHRSAIAQSDVQHATFRHTLDNTNYYVQAAWNQTAAVQQRPSHTFLIKPATTVNQFLAVFLFTPVVVKTALPCF
jgi:hypothetical protein